MAALDAGCPSGLEPPAAEVEQRPDPQAFVRRDNAGRETLEFLVKGASCAGCIRKIEGGLQSMPGVETAHLNLTTGRLSIAWRGGAPARTFLDRVASLGYDATAFDPAISAETVDGDGRALLRRLAVAGFASMNVMMFSVPVWGGEDMGANTRTLMYWLSALIAIPAALYAGQPFFRSAFSALRRGRANMDVPISLAVLVTLAMSLFETANQGRHAYFDGVVMLLFLLLIGRYLDHRLRERARTAARELLAMQAVTASRIGANGAISAVAARDIAPGDRLSVAAGDRIPVDAIVESGVSDLNRAILTGETTPIAVRPGDSVNAGALNIARALVVRASKRVADSTIAELARLIELGEQRRAGRMRIVDAAAALYVPIVHTLAALTFLGWLFADAGLRYALTNAVAVLIITCPCALGLAVPAVQIVATGRLFKRGIFIKSGDALERLAQADYLLLDKTGTLTRGEPELVSSHDSETLQAAAALARVSRHPLSRALVLAAGPGAAADGIAEHPGQGLEVTIGAIQARLGAKSFAAPEAPRSPHDGAELWYRRGGKPAVQFRFRDALRPGAATALAALRARGFEIELSSGDRPDAVAAAARETGISRWRGGVSPQDKVARLEELAAAGRKTLMLGDGLNDAAALAAAHVSGSPGTAIAASQAASDLVIQGDLLASLVEAIDVARAARRRVGENLVFSALYNAVAIPFAVFGFVTPLIAALAMSASSLAVTLNALRLAKGAR